MNKKLLIVIISSIVIILIGVVVTISYNSGVDLTNLVEKKEKKIEENAWVNIKSADKDEALLVRWDQKYGPTKTEYCKAVFYNKSEGLIKLVAPWLDITIVKANTNNIEYKVVAMDSVPNIR